MYDQQQQLGATATRSQRQKLSNRNTLCLCNAACPAETAEWMECARAAARAIRQGQQPKESCAVRLRKLERCTQATSGRLLQTALVPPDRDDVSL